MNKKGFTLVELLVVLVVIGALVGIILPNTLAAIRSANNKECASNLRNIDTAIQVCYSETRDWTQCNTFAQLVAGAYLERNPTCPFAAAYTIVANASGGFESDKTAHFAAWPPRTNADLLAGH